MKTKRSWNIHSHVLDELGVGIVFDKPKIGLEAFSQGIAHCASLTYQAFLDQFLVLLDEDRF